MEEVCDICGDPGVIEAIITCCECKVAREHLYCMRVFRTQAPPFWRCEECGQKKSVSPSTVVKERKFNSKTRKVSILMEKITQVTGTPSKTTIANRFNFKERNVVTGRTKYISCEEAVKLSSGSQNTSRNPNRCANEREFKTAKSELLPKSSKEPGKANTKTATSEFLPKSSKEPEKANTKTAKSEFLPKSSKEPGKANTKTATTSEFLPKSSKKPEKPNTKTGIKNHDNVEAGSSALVKPTVSSALCFTEKHNLYVPVTHSYWKGSFYLPTGHENLNDAFKAHIPRRVPDKVFETLVKMPENIYFELVPNQQVCMEIFSGYCPDYDDIGLYFFPRFKNRLENNNSIIDFLWRENLVLKSIVNGVELLVFSSKLLQPHSQEFQGNYFLWGVFRCVEIMNVVVNSLPLLEAKPEPCDDVPPGFTGFKKIFEPIDDVPPGFKKIVEAVYDVPPGFKKIVEPLDNVPPPGFKKIVEPVNDVPPGFKKIIEPADDVPPGFKKIIEPADDVPPGFKKIVEPFDDVPPGFKKICKP